MIPLIAAVFTASVLGSMHCAGMCGAFLAFAVGADTPAPTRSRLQLNAAYNLGRLVTYTILGGICGAMGAALNMGGSMLGVQRTAAILAGAIMVVFGLFAVLRQIGMHIPKMPLPDGLHRLLAAGHRRAFDLPPLMRASAIGLLTTLLPCGWLYAFAITAAGTAHPLDGALTMTTFWLGTLPVMITLGVSLQALSGSLRRYVPLATSLIVVVVGLWTIVGRMRAPMVGADQAGGVIRSASLQQTISRVESLPSQEMPCCHGR